MKRTEAFPVEPEWSPPTLSTYVCPRMPRHDARRLLPRVHVGGPTGRTTARAHCDPAHAASLGQVAHILDLQGQHEAAAAYRKAEEKVTMRLEAIKGQLRALTLHHGFIRFIGDVHRARRMCETDVIAPRAVSGSELGEVSESREIEQRDAH